VAEALSRALRRHMAQEESEVLPVLMRSLCMAEQRDMVWTPSFREEFEASRLAAECTEGGHFQDARAHLERAVELSTGTSRETGYRLRLTSITQGDRFVRLAEK
jgi:hypothetical protein